ncbi:MAG: hypothetical protein IKI11_03830 [Neisseriaceae bacterium]|nr:hypothetical protein [Neisseriaceae bacterium]
MKKLFLLFLSFALLNSPAWAFEWGKLHESESYILFVDEESSEEAVNNKQNIKGFWIKEIYLDGTLHKRFPHLSADAAILHTKLKANCKNKTFAIEELRVWDLQEKKMIGVIKRPVSKLDWNKMEGDPLGTLANGVCEISGKK